MKAEFHPDYKMITVSCSCGSRFETRSTYAQDELKVEVCKECHPFFTGKQKILDTEGRIDQFKRRYGVKQPTAE